ncbi:MAG: arginine decarboxylase, pyruvoyl-dependent, partial [Conexivisphaerales archaeon]
MLDVKLSYVPTKVFLTKGVGVHKDRLASFELALRDAGIAHCNLVTVSSIFPPRAKLIPRKQGIQLLRPGQIVHVVLSRLDTDEPNRLIAASVGVAIPKDKNAYGYLSELHAYGVTDEKLGEHAEDVAAYMLASTMGLDFDPDKSWNAQRQEWKISGKIYKTMNVTQSAEGNKDGLWSSVVAAAVLL